MTDFKNWLIFSEKIAREAGDIVLPIYHSDNAAQFKEGLDGRPSTVTAADTKSEAFLSEAIRQHFPDHGIYGEEGTREKMESDFVWYLDPIDGTTNFWRHIPLFGISVGLTYLKRPVLGVLFFPALNLLVSACKGEGTYANGKKNHVSDRSLEKSLYYISCQEARNGQAFPAVGKKVGWMKAVDVSSFEFAQIAMGDAELYTFFKMTPQDMVAGTVIVEEAGGKVTDELGQPWTTDSEIIVASNGLIHDEVLELMRVER